MRNYGTNEAYKHKRFCQQLCQEELGEQVYLNQRAVMRAGLKLEGSQAHVHDQQAYDLSDRERNECYRRGNVPRYHPRNAQAPRTWNT